MKVQEVRNLFKYVLRRKSKRGEQLSTRLLAAVIEREGAFWVLEMTKVLAAQRQQTRLGLTINSTPPAVHSCPYQAEVNEDHETMCACTPEETEACSDEI